MKTERRQDKCFEWPLATNRPGEMSTNCPGKDIHPYVYSSSVDPLTAEPTPPLIDDIDLLDSFYSSSHLMTDV